MKKHFCEEKVTMKRYLALFIALVLALSSVVIPVFATDETLAEETEAQEEKVERKTDIKLPNPEDFAAEALEKLEEKGVISHDEEGNVVFEYADEICTFYAKLSDKLYEAYLEFKPTEEEMEDIMDFVDSGLSFIQGIWGDFVNSMTDEELREEISEWFDETVEHVHRATDDIKQRIEAKLEETTESN